MMKREPYRLLLPVGAMDYRRSEAAKKRWHGDGERDKMRTQVHRLSALKILL
jgi:hypothetical protein